MTAPAPTSPDTRWTLATPSAPGAVAIIQLQYDIDAALHLCGITPVAPGEVKIRNLLGIDHGVVARWSADACDLMPHGGIAVVRQIIASLSSLGFAQGTAAYPEARSPVEARALATLARAMSPLAVDLLLAQHDLWQPPNPVSDPVRDRVLNRLIHPPLVVALGATNIGKSTLINALAGRGISIVADEPGTTRDHVGVMLDLAGLVVRYVDTPGLRNDAPDIETLAIAGAIEIASAADLLLLCGAGKVPPPALPASVAAKDRLTLALRSDLGPACFTPDIAISAHSGENIVALVDAIRDRLMPREMLARAQPWMFWDEDTASAQRAKRR